MSPESESPDLEPLLHGFSDWAEVANILTIAPVRLKPTHHIDCIDDARSASRSLRVSQNARSVIVFLAGNI